MNRYFLVLFLILIPVLSASTSLAQGFPWKDFKPRTLEDIVKIDSREINESEKENKMIVHADPLLSVSRVRYTGKSRPISKAKKEALLAWAKMFTGNADHYAALYEEDFAFTEGEVEYWLPVQNKVSAYFPKELSEGDEVDIYIVRAGGLCKNRMCDWLFLVEEFQKVSRN